MTLDSQLMKLVELFGPLILAVMGAILTATFSTLIALGRYAWSIHQKRMNMMAEALSSLAKGVTASQEKIAEEHRKIWETIQGLRAELHMSSKNAEALKTGMLKLEGALERQIMRVDTYVERMGKVDSKLEALFRFVDTPKRATDIAGR